MIRAAGDSARDAVDDVIGERLRELEDRLARALTGTVGKRKDSATHSPLKEQRRFVLAA